MRFDGLVLQLLLRELRQSLAGMRRRDLLWIWIGGGALVAYGLGINILWLVHNAAWVLATPEILFGAAAFVAATGLIDGFVLGRLAEARAHSRFLAALPLSEPRRTRMAASAALTFGAGLAGLTGLLALAGGLAVDAPWTALGALGAALLSFAAFAAGVALRLRRPWRDPEERRAGREAGSGRVRGIAIGRLDGGRPAWLGAWAWSLPAGRLRLGARGILLGVLLALGGLGAVVASLARDTAGPAIFAATLGGVALFMATLRCHPLVSPVLRASRIGFTRAMARLVRLPLLLSTAFFALVAGPALAAEPSIAALSGGVVGLVTLNAIYGVFAAFFATAPMVAAVSFFLALLLTWYNSLEYGRAILLALVALLVFLWVRARRRFRHG